MSKPKNISRTEKGQVIILLTAGLVTLLALVSLAIDGSMYYSDRRAAQGGVDAAAMSAAYAACIGEDPVQAAEYAASLSGFTTGGDNSVVVNSPPQSGEYAGQDGYVEVIITFVTEGTFSKVVTSQPLTNTVRTVSYCDTSGGSPQVQQITGNSAIIVLNPSAGKALWATGNGDVIVNSGDIFVNSSAGDAIRITGNGEMQAGSISIVGGYSLSGNADITPTPTTGVTAITDPYAGLPAPPKPAGPCTTVQVSGNTDLTLNPGLYCSIQSTGNGDLTLNPGVYWIESGKFKVTGNGDLNASEVFIYMGPNAGQMDFTGNGDFTISPPTSGDYAGMAVYQDPLNTNTFKITGNGDGTSLGGTFYFPSAHIKTSGNGDLVVSAQLICDTLKSTGNGDVLIDFGSPFIYQDDTAASYKISLME